MLFVSVETIPEFAEFDMSHSDQRAGLLKLPIDVGSFFLMTALDMHLQAFRKKLHFMSQALN